LLTSLGIPGDAQLGLVAQQVVSSFLLSSSGKAFQVRGEMRGAGYPHDNIVYTIQPKAWMNTAVYQEWVFAVLLPFI
jgi:hypothetical protein